MRKPDVIIFALPRWDGPYSSTAFSLAQEIAKSARVFYVDNPYTWKDLITGLGDRSIRKRIPALLFGVNKFQSLNATGTLTAVTPLVALPINFLPAGRAYRLFKRFNSFLVSKCIKSVLKKYNVSQFIFINSYNPFYLNRVNKFNPMLTIYHGVDDISESRYVAKHGVYLEKEIMQTFDITITTSEKLHNYARQFAQRVFKLPNAANFELFNNLKVVQPQELEFKTGKIIGYIGSIDHRIDYTILKAIVDYSPDWILLLVGPTSIEFKRSGLSLRKNVIAVGSKKLEELPSYVHAMDCGIIPFLCNELTASIYPLKLNEYLAAGKPVVSTNFSTDLSDFEDVISISKGKADFIRSLETELERDTPELVEKRVQKASGNSWESRVNEFWDKIVVNKV